MQDSDRIQQILNSILSATSSEERELILQRECGEDRELREKVESLLRVELATMAESADLKERAESSAANRTSDRPGVVLVDRYKLLKTVGEGGMGSVWKAEQLQPVKRIVAVKLIKKGMDSAQILARFEIERQTLALMDHPNIARVYDGGITDQGAPFFVMEYVEGEPLSDYCDKNNLNVEERLKLFHDVCQAIQHAHQKGIVHRDLKPSNILVCNIDGKPTPKVIDFGLAKAFNQGPTEQTQLTAHGVILGTPLYMSPEQADYTNIDIDTRSDIYSLGVILYELLTGSTPIDRQKMRAAAMNEIVRLICSEEPLKPSSRLSSSEGIADIASHRRVDAARLRRAIAGDLDWIVMKAIEKERNRRYESVSGFARDIERFLNNEAVEACPPSATYRIKKFVQKHRALISTAASFVLLLVVGAMVSTWLAIRAMNAESVADSERRKAQDAERQTLEDYRASTDDAIEQLIGSKSEIGASERNYLERTLERWKVFANRQGDDAHSRAIQAEGHFRVGSIWQTLGRNAEAVEELEKARDLQINLLREFPSTIAYQVALARTHGDLSVVQSNVGKFNEAETEYKATLQLQQALVDQFPNNLDYQHDIARTHQNKGNFSSSLGQWDNAKKSYRIAIEKLSTLVSKEPKSKMFRQDLALAQHNLGLLLLDIGELEESGKELEAARTLRQALATEFPETPLLRKELADSYIDLAALHYQMANPNEALKEIEKGRDLYQALVEEYPAIPTYRRELGLIQNNLGVLQIDQELFEKALEYFELGRAQRQKLVDRYPDRPSYRNDLAVSYNNIAIALEGLRRTEEQIAAQEKARAIQEQLVKDFPSEHIFKGGLAVTLNNLGLSYSNLDNYPQAIAEYEAAERVSSELVAEHSDVPEYGQQYVRSLSELANVYKRQNAHEKALGRYRAGVAHSEKLLQASPDSPHSNLALVSCQISIPKVLLQLARMGEAKLENNKTIDTVTKLVQQYPNMPEFRLALSESLCISSQILLMEANHTESLAQVDKALENLAIFLEPGMAYPSAGSFFVSCYSTRARLHATMGNYPAALDDCEKSLTFGDPSKQQPVEIVKAYVYAKSGDVDAAVQNAEKLGSVTGWESQQLYELGRVWAVVAEKTTDNELKRNRVGQAISLLRSAVEKGHKLTPATADDPDFAALKALPEFAELISQP